MASNDSTEMFRDLVEMSQDLIWQCDAEGRYTYLNPAWEATFGYTLAEMLGKRFTDFQTPEMAQRDKQEFSRLMQGGVVSDLETVHVGKNGEPIHLLFNAKYTRNENGNIVGTRGIAQNISQRKTAEDSLQSSQEQLSAFLQNSPIYAYIKKVTQKESRVLQASDNFKNMIGISGRDMIGKTMTELFPPEISKKMTEDDWFVASKGETLRIDEELNGRSYTSIKFPIRQGENVLLAGYSIDITELKNKEAALLDAEKNFRALFEKGPIGVAFHEMIYDESGKAIDYRFIDANKSYQELTGVDPRGKTVIEAFPGIENDPFDWIGTFGKVAKTGQEIRFETYLQANDRWYDCVGYQYKPDHFVAAFIEITKRKKAEEALRENEAVFRVHVENSFDVLFTLNDRGEFVFASPAWDRHYGYPASSVIGKSFADYVHPEDVAPCQEYLMHCLSTGQGGSSPPYRVKHANGGWVWFTANGTPFTNGQGERQLIGVGHDITGIKNKEEALLEADKKFRALFEKGPIGVAFHEMVYDESGKAIDYRFIDANKSYQELTGVDPRGKTVIEAFPGIENDPFDWIGKFGKVAKTGEEVRFETYLQANDRWYDCVGYQYKPDHFVAAFIETTKRKKAEEALQESERQFADMATNSPGVIYQFYARKDGTTGFYYVGPKSEEILGLSSDVSSPDWQNLGELLHPDDKQAFIDAVGSAIVQMKELNFECRMMTKMGMKWIHFLSKPMIKNNEIVFNGIITDITERKKSEDKLRISEEKLSTLFTSMTEMVLLHELVFNEQGEPVNYRIMDCNRAFTSLTGISKEAAIGKLATEVYHTEVAPHLEDYAQVAITGEPFESTEYFESSDKHFSVSVVSPRKNSFATISTDVTSIRHIQQVITAKNKELENYLYVASHDLRSPLVNIQGFSQRLQSQTQEISEILVGSNLDPSIQKGIETIANEGIPRSLHYITSSVTKMDALISGLLEISRTGRVEMTIGLVKMDKLFKSIVSAQGFQISEVSAQIQLTDIPNCYGDENLLNQLFSNLIGNAVKYRDKQRPLQIEISGKVDANKVRYTVKDNGIGIEGRHIEKIWDVFYRVDPVSKGTGDGLGLSIIKRIADRHRGRVWAESEPGVGSQFHVELSRVAFVNGN
jgi:PAS domain S-box-containing protein